MFPYILHSSAYSDPRIQEASAEAVDLRICKQNESISYFDSSADILSSSSERIEIKKEEKEQEEDENENEFGKNENGIRTQNEIEDDKSLFRFHRFKSKKFRYSSSFISTPSTSQHYSENESSSFTTPSYLERLRQIDSSYPIKNEPVDVIDYQLSTIDSSRTSYSSSSDRPEFLNEDSHNSDFQRNLFWYHQRRIQEAQSVKCSERANSIPPPPSTIIPSSIPPLDPKGKRGRPRKHAPKIPLPPLYIFIRNLLHNRVYNPRVVSWANETSGIFKVNHTAEFAKTWGLMKSNRSEEMNYEKMSRAMRYHYGSEKRGRKGHLAMVKEKRLMYKFGELAVNWRSSELHYDKCEIHELCRGSLCLWTKE